jgi:hypothetical protein
MRRPPFARVLIAAALAVLAACVDQTQVTAPNEFTAISRPAQVFSSPVGVQAVAWGKSHSARSYTASATIGGEGGSLEIRGCDMTLVVPPGAISKATQISATCVNDGFVGYSFEPHGLRFKQPVIVTQGLSNVQSKIGADALFAAYLDDASEVISANGRANAIELPAISVSGKVQTWLLHHFSRYILASGYTEPEPDSTQTPQQD